MLKGVLSTPVFRLHLVMFCYIITNMWSDISNSYMARDNLPSFEYFRKIALTICLQKTRQDSSPSSLLIWYNTLAPWKTTSTIQTSVATLRKSHRFTRFTRSYVKRPAVVQNHCQSYTVFLLYESCSKSPFSVFLQLFVAEDSAFALVSTPVAQMLWTLRRFGRRTNVK